MKRTAYMYGYSLAEPETTGWLRIGQSGKYEIVENLESATGFAYRNPSKKKKGWARPEKWLEFFNTEPELNEWRFHIVKLTENRK